MPACILLFDRKSAENEKRHENSKIICNTIAIEPNKQKNDISDRAYDDRDCSACNKKPHAAPLDPGKIPIHDNRAIEPKEDKREEIHSKKRVCWPKGDIIETAGTIKEIA